jgi:lipid-binding SYLF domain-containing protein
MFRRTLSFLGDSDMGMLHRLRAGLIGLIALVGASVSSTAYADSGTIRITVLKAGWFIGGSGGSGVLVFHGRRYPLSIGGISAGLVFGASQANFVGTVSNIFRPSDVAGVYGAASAGAALGVGAGTIVLSNDKGAVLSMNGSQVGLIANLDLSGLAISLR